MRCSRPLARAFGQALHANRPHLVEKGHLTPLVPAEEFAERRRKVLDQMAPNSLAIFPANRVQFATGSVFHKFRQDPNFQYLTGFLEPGACLMLLKKPNGTSTEVLAVPEKDAHTEKWEGERTGTELAKSTFGIDVTVPNSHMNACVSTLLASVENVYTDLDPAATVRAGAFYSKDLPALVGSRKLLASRPLVESLRLIKSENEIDCMRVASEISASVFNEAYKMPFTSEHELHAFLDYKFRQGGCESDAYLAVVAGGPHALTIHYVRNDDILRPGELVLVDAGGRYGGYCADISRTWPVDGKFTGPQRDLYEAVLAVEKACIAKCTSEQGLSMNDLHMFSMEQMQSELANVGLRLKPSQVSKVYPHSIGHNLGLDVHDVAAAGKQPLRANQVVTVEPGVYIPFDDAFPKHFQGIGIRIEDNVVVGNNNYEVLTADCGKEVDEVER